MLTRTATELFAELTNKEPIDEYNFEHFRFKHLKRDGQRTIHDIGVCPGDLAPDFVLSRAGGGTVQLSALRGRPVLLHFGSFT